MRNLPVVTRNLLLVNIVIFLLTIVSERYGLDLNNVLGMHYVLAGQFHWWQPFTYMFCHANLQHIFFNMFAVLMFGPVLEREWGERRYLLYYLVCGLGAAVAQESVWAFMVQPNLAGLSLAEAALATNGLVTIGASGAVFGILFAFGWLFPNVPMFLFFIPIPIRARVMVIGYAVIELLAGVRGLVGMSADNVAHFAHLGGMLFGWLLLLWWRKNGWNDPEWGCKLRTWWRKLRNKYPRLDSSSDKDYSDYHYQKKL